MSDKVVIQSDQAPAPIGPYSQAVKTGSLLLISGQIGLDPKTGRLAGPDTASQLEQILKSVNAILEFNGLSPGHVVRCVVYVLDLNEMPAINKILENYFVFEPPARTTLQVAALPAGARIEVEATATLG